jgi:hypothetical protein
LLTTAKKAVSSSPTLNTGQNIGGGGVNRKQNNQNQHQHPNRGHGVTLQTNNIFSVFGLDLESKSAAIKYSNLYKNTDQTSQILAKKHEQILQNNGYIITTKPALKFEKLEWEV